MRNLFFIFIIVPVVSQLHAQNDLFLDQAQPENSKYINASLGTYRHLSKFKLEDHQAARDIDSLWLGELINSGVYKEMMNQNVLANPHPKGELTASDYETLSTEVLKERLQALNHNTPFNIAYNPELEKMVHFYLRQNKTYMERLMSLSRYYFPMFEEELARRDMPLDLKYLAIIESGLNPRIKSRVGATGLWQFMFSSAKMQGLTISNYVDERMDPLKSTAAAVDYLEKLHRMFGDWDMALAAYNSGPGNVSKAIRRSGGETNYWKLKRFLPRETANYVPSFLAALYVFNYAEEHGYNPYAPDALYFATDTVMVKENIKFKHITDATGIPEELIQFLNPAYKLDIIPKVEGKEYSLRLPLSEIGLFVANEELIYSYVQEQLEDEKIPDYSEQSDRIRYRVKKGDFLGRIAQRYGVSVASIRQWNNLRNNNIRAGQLLTIYPRR